MSTNGLRLGLGETEAFAQAGTGFLGGLRCLYDLYDFVDVLYGNHKALEYVCAVFGLAELEFCAAGHHFAAVIVESLADFFEVEGLGSAVYEGDVVDAERRLHRRELVELVEHHVGIGIRAQGYDNPHTVAV